jgi:hypothetical protein
MPPRKPKVTTPSQTATKSAPQPVTVTYIPTVTCALCGAEMVPDRLSGHYEREHPIEVAQAVTASR